MNKKLIIFLFIILLAGIFHIILYASKSTLLSQASKSLSGFSVQAVILPDTLFFASERVPLEYFDIKESLDREIHVNTYFHSQTILLIKRSKRFFSIIEKILSEEGVPEDFKYLAVAESGLLNVVSPAKATGFWQFLKKTAEEHGLIINEEIDERYHLEKSTRAACKYLKNAYQELGNWTLAAASYNMGLPGLKKLMEKQKQGSYYDLHLPEETSRYVFRILALKLIIQNPEKYGFYIDTSDYYNPLPYKLVKVDTTINNLYDFSIQLGTNYKLLVLMNPWIRSNTLKATPNQPYTLKIVDNKARKTK